VTIVLPFWGTIGAIVIWATQKDKSSFVGFQSLQAVVYHLVLVLAGFLAGACYLCTLVAFPVMMTLTVPVSAPSGDFSPAFMLPIMIPFAILGASMLGWLAFVIYGLVAAAATLQGKDFRYAVIGRRLEAYLAHP
jgi:uncharacterized Tic20 family protein